MDKVIKLTKIFLKNSFASMDAKMGVSSKSKSRALLYGLLFLYFAGLIIFFSYNLLDGLITIHQEKVFIGIILFMIFSLAVIQTIFSSINVLYFTKDNEYLLPLPLKPYQIILARTNVMLLTEYIILFLVGMIPLIIYGILTNAYPTYYILMLLTVIILPILPVLLISTIVMIIMSFAKFTKNRNKFQMIAYFIMLVIVIAISVTTSGMQQDVSNEEMAQMVIQANGMLELIKGYVPTVDFLIGALTTDNLLVSINQILKTIVITIAGFIVYMLIAQKIYFKGLVGNLFGGKTKKSTKNIHQNKYTQSKLYKSYIGKEFKNLIRNPVFLMQCFLPAILIPIVMVIVTFAGLNGEEMQMQEISSLFAGLDVNSFIVSSIILGIIQFFTMFIYISITAISRDGENAVFIKYIPVSLYKQYIYKSIPNVIMNMISIIISLCIAQYILHLSPVLLIILFLIATIMGVLQSLLMLIVDLKRPKLNWDSEYAVAKQNMNLIFTAILGMINIAIIAALCILLNSFNVYIGLFILAVIFIIATIITNQYLRKNQYKLAERII